MKPLIGITVGEIQNALYPWAPAVYGQTYHYCQAIERVGGVPCLIPLMDNMQNLEQLYKKTDGILFAGGNDINPRLYGQQPYPTTIGMSDKRDAIEMQLLKWLLRNKKPMLGICRGMQILNIACGGTLYQDIVTDVGSTVDHTASTTEQNIEHQAHTVMLSPSSRLAHILGKRMITTNSHHHQAIHNLGKNLAAVAWADDGVIEAVESQDDSYIFGVQCHPEFLEDRAAPEFRKLFKSFVDAARRM